MKNHKKIIRIALMLCVCALFSACDLTLHKDFKFKDELGPEITFETMTAWDWVQTRITPADSVAVNGYDPEEFDLMIKAIKMTGLIDEYNQTETTDRTYLMLDNNAFEGGNEIIAALSPDDVEEPTLDDVDVDRLRTLLKYHIVTTKIKQVPTLFEYGVNYKFQTLIPGEEGEIYFRRDERYNITINDFSGLPSSRKKASVHVHNYVFKNGIGHILASYVRNVEF